MTHDDRNRAEEQALLERLLNNAEPDPAVQRIDDVTEQFDAFQSMLANYFWEAADNEERVRLLAHAERDLAALLDKVRRDLSGLVIPAEQTGGER